MAYATHRDRSPHDLELVNPAFPVSPLNLFLTSGYNPGVFDLCWDDPSNLAGNANFSIYGVNIYRSFDSEFGPYFRLTEQPAGSTFFRDQTDNTWVLDEVVEDHQWVLRGEAGDFGETMFVFHTLRSPIVTSGSQAVENCDAHSVRVSIDGVSAVVRKVVGSTGEITIETLPYADIETQQLVYPPKVSATSVVKVSYLYNRSLLRTNLGTRVYYRVTTLGVPITANMDVIQPKDLIETPLERAVLTSSREIEKRDYIWTESVRRNRWILQQGGERVKLFVRKTVGPKCGCRETIYQHALGDCPTCYGTGFVGGYEGPYDILLAPDDAERRLNHSDRGLQQEHTYEVWTGPSPLISQRDFIVKVNGERYSVGAVRMPTNRGMILQQHFNIGILGESDIRYSVPLDGPLGLYTVRQTPPMSYPAKVTSKPAIPDPRELRGRTLVWENITY